MNFFLLARMAGEGDTKVGTTPMVFSSTHFSASSAVIIRRSPSMWHFAQFDIKVAGKFVPADLYRAGTPCSVYQLIFRPASWLCASSISAPCHQASRLQKSRWLSIRAYRSAAGECQRSASIFTQRCSSSAVCGYSSLSIMFLSMERSINW